MTRASQKVELNALRATLDRRFRTATSMVALGGREVKLLHPASAEDLIDETEFERDERLPYWADVWPSARVLAGVLAAQKGTGRSLLELGCGSGLVATAAALAGFDVCATDYYEDALLFTRLNVWQNSGSCPHTRLVDWRHVPTDLGRHDLVVGSDVLYEKAYGSLVARAIDMTLAHGGEAIVADPGRVAAPDFLQDAAQRGLHVSAQQQVPFEEGQIRQRIDLYHLRRA